MDKLAVILADMLRSALAWEHVHGESPRADDRDKSKPLTRIRGSYTLASDAK